MITGNEIKCKKIEAKSGNKTNKQLIQKTSPKITKHKGEKEKKKSEKR